MTSWIKTIFSRKVMSVIKNYLGMM